MKEKIDEPESVNLSSSEFMKKLNDEYSKEIRRECNRFIFNKDPLRYKEMGLNEYLEKDVECREEIVIPRMDIGGLQSLAFGANVSIRIDRLNKDTNIIILLVDGTKTNISYFKSKLEEIHERFPDKNKMDGTVRLIDIPLNMEEEIIGRNGVNIYKMQKRFGVVLRTMDKKSEGLKVLIISGHLEKVNSASDYIVDMVYKDEV